MKKLTRFTVIFVALIMVFSLVKTTVFALENIENTLGKKTTQIMLTEIKNSINKYSTITNNDALEIIKDITSIYGLELSDEEVQSIYNQISGDLTVKVTDKVTLIDKVKMFFQNLSEKVEETFPSLKDKEVVITLPRMSQVDEWVNDGIDYIVHNFLPLLFSQILLKI